jgi:hypothetical protein
MRQLIKSGLRKLGYDLVAPSNAYPDITADEWAIIHFVESYSCTSIERLVSVIRATEYLIANQISGDIVECGVWRGGSAMAAALTLEKGGDTTRNFYLYDTFSGMSVPTGDDRLAGTDVSAAELLSKHDNGTGYWCYADRADVERNMVSTRYPGDRIIYVEGKVDETIPKTIPERIALLRLDTDWYESTKHELIHLFPRLVNFGILIVDDYGHWTGAKKATDEYFADFSPKPFLSRIDYTGRLLIKN